MENIFFRDNLEIDLDHDLVHQVDMIYGFKSKHEESSTTESLLVIKKADRMLIKNLNAKRIFKELLRPSIIGPEAFLAEIEIDLLLENYFVSDLDLPFKSLQIQISKEQGDILVGAFYKLIKSRNNLFERAGTTKLMRILQSVLSCYQGYSRDYLEKTVKSKYLKLQDHPWIKRIS
jgi:hypothetical protein